MKCRLACLLVAGLWIQTAWNPAWSQTPDKLNKKLNDWYYGTIITSAGETLECEFSYNPIAYEGLVQFQHEGIRHTAGPSKITSFSFYDEEKRQVRQFQSFPVLNEYTGVTTDLFMEVLHETRYISLVGRKTTDLRQAIWGGTNGNGNTKVVKDYDRFLIDMATGRMYNMYKKELLKLTNDKKKTIKSYLKTERIRLITSEDFVKVIDYYSSIK